MDCALISIGDELLIGQTVNTNAAWLGKQLNLLGYKVVAGVVIPDDENAILNALDELSIKADLIIITGGLGPTKDDITKHTLCDYFETKLERNLVIEQQIVDYFNSRQLPILQTNKDQALIPLACELLPNSSISPIITTTSKSQCFSLKLLKFFRAAFIDAGLAL